MQVAKLPLQEHSTSDVSCHCFQQPSGMLKLYFPPKEWAIWHDSSNSLPSPLSVHEAAETFDFIWEYIKRVQNDFMGFKDLRVQLQEPEVSHSRALSLLPLLVSAVLLPTSVCVMEDKTENKNQNSCTVSI